MVQALDCLVGEAMLSKLFDVLMSAETCVHVRLCMCVCACVYAFVPGFVTEEQDFDIFLWGELDKGEHSDLGVWL